MKPEFPLLAACIGLVLSSCGPDKNQPVADGSDKPVPKGPTLIGRIASVPPDKHFVLVQRYGKWEGQSGQILTTRGPENRTANLRTTGEKLGEFAAADIQSGVVQIGDAVYLQHIPNPVQPPPSSDQPIAPAKPATAPATVTATGTTDAAVGNVQKNN